jgi:hypothetical protein
MRHLVPPEYAEDLFGQPVTPREEHIPRRGSSGYLSHIHSLPLPDGLEFITLSAEPIPMGAPSWVESVCCLDKRREWRHLLIDIRSGERWESW